VSGARSGSRGREGPPPAARPRLERWLLLLAVVLALLLYLRSPIDLLPDRLGGIGLVDDLVVMIAVLWWAHRRFRQAAPPRTRRRAARPIPPRPAPSGWDPYRVLGVARGAEPDAITRAYREQMKLYHPDRVAELGEELRALAHEKSLDIQRAYEEIGPRKG
jgi:uncharacterized membrane protein YkvA (DUF1232 family)